MNKHHVIEQIQAYLVDELAVLADSGVEGDLARAGEIQRLLQMYKFLPVREYGVNDVVCPSALVELEVNGTRAFYFVVPQGGGLIASVDGKPVQVITPQSPLGEVMMGKKTGDCFSVEIGKKTREYRIVSLF